ncbi:DUF4142 domain-containing protein [Conexibacter arvalis]|uniref:Putative outer membrane protein n=1 Tax=Conexibacter arvalis TaxID=912552 RepID=A0A840IDJ9_9ACTN|nr:DUF4142 domain-containing protein [Conexibacter arvalis]MBB4662144.1 putative outer membrane protein [Conexibacter arvalis]
MRLSPKPLAVVIAAAALVVLPSTASANDGPRHADGHSRHARIAPISAEAYLPAAAQANRFEIVTGQLAQQRAESSEVRALGAMFVTDHTRLLEQGSAVAAALGVAVPEGLSPRQQATVEALARLRGPDFDAAWIDAQIAAHRDALLLNLRAAIRGEQPQIRTLGQGALPIITRHLGELLDLSEAARGPGNDRHGDNGRRGDHGDRGDHGGRKHGHHRHAHARQR